VLCGLLLVCCFFLVSVVAGVGLVLWVLHVQLTLKLTLSLLTCSLHRAPGVHSMFGMPAQGKVVAAWHWLSTPAPVFVSVELPHVVCDTVVACECMRILALGNN